MSISSASGITVIVPTHNGRPSVRATIDALLSHGYPHLEVIVISDGDATLTREILKPVTDERMLILEKAKEGSAAARNAGLKAARRHWVSFVDDDDVPRSNWIDTWVQHIRPDAAVITAGVAYMRDGRVERTRTCRLSPADPTMGASTILAGAFLVRRDVLLAVGGYDAALRAAQNQDLGLRLLEYLVNHHSPLRIVSLDDTVIDVTLQDPKERFLRYGTSRADSARIFLSRYAGRLRNDPSHHASLLRIIARSAWDSQDFDMARRAALTAVRVEPSNPANFRSVILAFFPSLRRALHRHRGDRSE